MTGANYKCPHCDGKLLGTETPDTYECNRCSSTIKEAVAENQETLQQLADSDLSCSWIAESLLDTEAAGGEP